MREEFDTKEKGDGKSEVSSILVENSYRGVVVKGTLRVDTSLPQEEVLVPVG